MNLFVEIPQQLMKHSLLVIFICVIVDLNGMHDEQVPDDGDDQLGAPVATAEKKYFIFLLVAFFSLIIILMQSTFEETSKRSSSILVSAKITFTKCFFEGSQRLCFLPHSHQRWLLTFGPLK